MSTTIHVSLACACDADELVDFISSRGMTGMVTALDDHCEVAVGYPETRLHDDFERALASWLEQRDRPLVPIEVDQGDYVLRPPGD